MNKPSLENEDLAEFIGIMLGDGSIGEYECRTGDVVKTHRRVKVTLSGSEEKYCDYIENLFEELFGISPIVRPRKNENTVDIAVYRKALLEFLVEEVGLKLAPKWERAEIPEFYCAKESYSDKILRGYFDTDGSVVLTDNNGTLYPRLEMKISPSPMQEQIIGILDQRGFRFGTYDIGKGKVRIQMNGKTQLRKWSDEIGFRNEKHVRKKNEVLK